MSVALASTLRGVGGLVRQHNTYVLYRWEAGRPIPSPDPSVEPCFHWRHMPGPLAASVLPQPLLQPMAHRLARGDATLLALWENGDPCAWGWMQAWRPFHRRLGWFEADATMLGPYWVKPERRGQGLYGRLLVSSISLAALRSKPIVIFTTPENAASQRGIEKAGFDRAGTWEVRTFIRRSVAVAELLEE